MSDYNEVNIAKWIVALRSGGYRQTKGKLRASRGGAMCCLGVACEVSGLGKWVPVRGECERREYLISDYEGDDTTLPPSVAEWLFGSRYMENPPLANPGNKKSEWDDSFQCTDANDEHNMTFREIADALETEYLRGKKAEDILAGATQ